MVMFWTYSSDATMYRAKGAGVAGVLLHEEIRCPAGSGGTGATRRQRRVNGRPLYGEAPAGSLPDGSEGWDAVRREEEQT